ncbi:MAG: tripartite tricarboxylate transporter substrate binding protein [Deltaproteobacteria bacterium]|nr:tripartite tricarboxylate transporter substrate binding protein [Deltaproteobacteria bacterium]MBW2121832.1 tripartite tricarboxylate transporter substrate binding protein [Deltaproteobacteria bacterium]
MKSRRFFVVLAAAAALVLLVPWLGGGPFCAEQKYPVKPIKLICPYGAGGATDLAARILTSVIPEFLNQAVVVVNKPGAGGAVGFDFVRRSRPDGYTMMMTAIGANVLVPAINLKVPYKYDDLVYIARTQINPNVLIVNAKSPWKTFQDLAQALKNNPGKYRFSTAGVGNVSHLGPIVLLKELGLPNDAAIPVHYDSDGAAILALIQGEADFWQANLAPAAGNIKGGLVRALAVTTPKRVPGFDDIPTYTELGYPGIDIVGWRGVAGPPGLPDHIAKIWEEAVAKSCRSKSWLKLVRKLGDEPGYMDTEEFNRFVHKEFKRYRKLFTELGLLIK